MNTRTVFKIMLSILILLCLTGCWNYREINQVRIVWGFALDYKEDSNEYIITVEIIKTAAKESEEKMSGETYTTTGKTVFEAVRSIITSTGKKLYWGDTAILVISQEIAKKGIIPAIDLVLRDAELRSGMWLLVSKEETAREILSFHKEILSKVISSQLNKILLNEKSNPVFHGVYIWQFAQDLYSDTISATCPAIKITEEDNVQEIGGTAVFKEATLVGWLSEEETRYFIWIIDELKNGVYTYEIADKAEGFYDDITFEILKSKTKTTAKYIDGKILMKLDIDCSIAIGEFSGTDDILNPDKLSTIEKAIEDDIKKNIEFLIRKVQNQYKTDIFGFRTVIKKSMPELWKNEIKPSWDYYFDNLITEATIEIEILSSGTALKPLKAVD